jgi:hypothetical protein
MKPRSMVIFLTIALTPFVIGLSLFIFEKTQAAHQKIDFVTDTREDNGSVTYKGIKIDWTFCPNWKYKPLLFSAREYLVFMFHYTNGNMSQVQLMPSYSLVSPGERNYSANEEISMYIEDRLENELKLSDETSVTYAISPGDVKHYIATFEKAPSVDSFYVDVDIFRDLTLRIHYAKKGNSWINFKNELIKKYKGRG